MVDEQQQSRVAELMHELIGASMATKLVVEVWESTPAEAKERIAAELVQKASTSVSSYDLRDLVRGYVAEKVRQELDARKAEIEPAIVEAVERQWQQQIESAAQQVLGEVLGQVAREFRMKIR